MSENVAGVYSNVCQSVLLLLLLLLLWLLLCSYHVRAGLMVQM